MKQSTEHQRFYTPEGFSGEVETPVDVLRFTHALLKEEGRWTTGSWYENAHPEVDPQDPFCNSWSVCVEGGMGLAIWGASDHVYDSTEGRAFVTEWVVHNGPALDHEFHKWGHTPTKEELALFEASKLLFVRGAIEANGGCGWDDEPALAAADYDAYEFNDHEGVKRDEILSYLEQAIKIGEAEEA